MTNSKPVVDKPQLTRDDRNLLFAFAVFLIDRGIIPQLTFGDAKELLAAFAADVAAGKY